MHIVKKGETLSDFNSRFREGSDATVPANPSLFWISIHASAKEATDLWDQVQDLSDISIHASAKEATSVMW